MCMADKKKKCFVGAPIFVTQTSTGANFSDVVSLAIQICLKICRAVISFPGPFY